MLKFKTILTVMLVLAFASQDILAANREAADARENNPLANPDATVVCGNARFTILTPNLIRLEYSPSKKWQDNKTLTVVNRNLEVPHFEKTKTKNGVIIRTAALSLEYRNTGKPFEASNLSITFDLNGEPVTWTPGMADDGNLKGTMRTLDGVDGAAFDRNRMELGILSRSGWAIVDDSSTPLLVPTDSHWGDWVKPHPDNGNSDLYFFGYGHDYKKALSDYQLIAGKAVLPPKYTLGYWWSRYWQYSDDEFKDLIAKIKSYNIPIDVLIVDMDWHETFGLGTDKAQKDEFGQRVGWTGYTWQKELFPSPRAFLDWTERENLKTALNLHPASGIQPYEECYEDFVKLFPAEKKGNAVPYMLDDEKWADAYFATVLGPMEDIGVDFWWNDWQQWLESKYTKGLSNTFWLNHVFFHHAKERARAEAANGAARPFIYHRWGGLGSHRYPLGFSGDTFVTWGTLGFLPWFTSTASNVNYGYWGHDIGGHMFGKGVRKTDPELYLRWLQYGVFTPIFKTHSSKNNRIVRYPWSFPDHQFMMRDAIRLRYALVPYIYNAARENYDTGVAMCRPMYYDYPEHDKAYSSPQQYLFGNDIIATAISSPADSVTGLAPARIWFPEGKWFDLSTGNMYEGDREVEMSYTLAENPWFAKAGAIIPMNPANVNTLQTPCDTLVLQFIPGADGYLRHYEDDGVTDLYNDEFAITEVTKQRLPGKIKVGIASREGSYAGAPASRSYELRFPAIMPPSSVKVNGKEYPYSRFAQPGTWTYDGVRLQPVVYTESLPTADDAGIVLEYDGYEAENPELYGKHGIFSRCRVLTPEFKEEQALRGYGKGMLPEGYLKVSQCANFIEERPGEINKYLDEFRKSKEALGATLDSSKIGERFRQRVKTQLSISD